MVSLCFGLSGELSFYDSDGTIDRPYRTLGNNRGMWCLNETNYSPFRKGPTEPSGTNTL